MFSTKVDHLVLNQTPILFLFNVPKEFILRQQHILSIWSTKNKYEQYVHVKKVPKKEIVISSKHWWNLPWQGSLLKQQIIQIYFKMLLNPMRTSERRFFWSVMDCWRGPWTLKVQLRHFLTNHNSSQDCFKTISFEHVDSWANILHFRTHHL